MNLTKYIRIGVALLLTGLALPSVAEVKIVGEKFDLLQTKSEVYTNVTITTANKDFLCISHSRGIGTVKVANLPDEELIRLGYMSGPRKTVSGELNAYSAQLKALFSRVDLSAAEPVTKAWQETMEKGFSANTPARNLILGILGGLFLCYLFACYCAHLICTKAGYRPGFLIWFPVLQWFPLLKAAEMHLAWFVGLLLPGINFIAYIVWAVKITRARGKHGFTAFLLLLPVLNVFAFLYLAFSSGKSSKDDTKSRGKMGAPIMTLETA